MIIPHEDDPGMDILIKTELLTPLIDYSIEHPLSESDVLDLGIDITRALDFCSRYGIIHRDIKPENIFMSPGGDYKLGDFGVAKVLEESRRSLSRKGTYTYMSPEVFYGNKYDASVDLYSLGLVMYKYLNYGRNPFMPAYPAKVSLDDMENSFTERMTGKPLPEPAEGSPELKRIILRACEYEPGNRYQSAGEMLADLEALRYREAGRGTEAGRSGAKAGKRGAAAAVRNGSANSRRNGAADPDHAGRNAGDATDTTAPLNIKKRHIAIFIAAILVAFGVGVYATIPKEVTDITGIDSEVRLYYDETFTPEYQLEPEGWFDDEPIEFDSSDDKVFTVNTEGELTAVSIGEADLTMTTKGYTEVSHIEVEPKVTSITGIDKAYDLQTGATAELEPVLAPEEFAGEPVTYTAKDSSVASVAEDGTVTALKAGTTTLTIAAGGTSIQAEVTVTDPPPPPVTYNNSGSSSKKSSKSSSKSGSSGGSGSKGYFSNEDDEHF